jgi:hypothetical protein
VCGGCFLSNVEILDLYVHGPSGSHITNPNLLMLFGGVTKLNIGSCFHLLCSFGFMPIYLLPLFSYCLVAW